MSGRNDAIHSRFMDLPVNPEVWDMLEMMARTKGKTSVGELLAEIATNYVQSLEACPICEGQEDRRSECVGCGGEGFYEQLSFRVIHIEGKGA